MSHYFTRVESNFLFPLLIMHHLSFSGKFKQAKSMMGCLKCFDPFTCQLLLKQHAGVRILVHINLLHQIPCKHTQTHIYTHIQADLLDIPPRGAEEVSDCRAALGSARVADTSRVSPDAGLCVVIFCINYSP